MSEALTTAFTTAVTGIQTDVMDLLGVAIVPALAIFGVGVALAFGKRFFTTLAN